MIKVGNVTFLPSVYCDVQVTRLWPWWRHLCPSSAQVS